MPCQPCALEIPWRTAHTVPSANRPTCPTSPTCPTFFAPTLCIAQCALPANSLRSYVLWKFRGTWLSLHHVLLALRSLRRRRVRTSPYKSVQVRTSPYSLARTLCLAQCALPAKGNALCFFLKAMHMAHGGKPHFSPRVPPFRPCAVWRPAARNAASLRLEALAPSPAAVGRLSARCHSAAPNILGAVAAPLCSDSLPRPLRARHRRASPRVLEKAQGCSARTLCSAQSASLCVAFLF